MDFASLGLSENIAKAVALTPAIPNPHAVPGRDNSRCAGRPGPAWFRAQTGYRQDRGLHAAVPCRRLSTAPTIQGSYGPRMLVFTPTRELAVQVTEACGRATARTCATRASAVSVLGGMPYPVQNKLLLKGPV
jgi:hypothetical protein